MRGFAVQFEGWTAGRKIGDLEILPADAALPTGADGFHTGFLSGETAGVALEAVGSPLHVGDLSGRVDALDEAGAIARDVGADAVHLGQVDAGPKDHFNSAPEVVMVRRPCLTPLVLIRASAIFCTAPAFPRTTSTSRQLS